MTRAIGLFALLTLAMTWPQARVIATEATPHQDVYFNMWRLEWFAHAIATQPSRLFDANVFHPEPDTLALSDAMIVEGAAAAPLIWAHMPPLRQHNVLLLAAIALSGAAMCALARYLTGSRAAAIVAGVIFAFAPSLRHVMHLELSGRCGCRSRFSRSIVCDTGRMKWRGARLVSRAADAVEHLLRNLLAAVISLGALR